MPSDAELLERFKSWTPQIDKWRDRVSKPFYPHPDGGLAHDDEIYPRSPLTNSAPAALGLAVDHVQAVRVLTEAESFHPSATFSLLRGALVSASTAVWILGEREPKTRQARSLAYIEAGDKKELEYGNELRAHSGMLARNAALSRLRIATAAVGMRYSVIRSGLPSVKFPHDGTTAVRYARDRVFAIDADLGTELMVLWRSTSADAHGLAWAAMQRAALDRHLTGSRQLPRMDTTSYALGGSAYHTVYPFGLVCAVVQWAFDRLDELDRPDRNPLAKTNVRVRAEWIR